MFRIIEDQDEAIEILKREVEALKKGEGMVRSPTSRKRERIAETEGDSGQTRCPASLWRPNDHANSDFEGRNGWVPWHLPRHCPVRHPLARNVLMEQTRTNIPPLSVYDGTADLDDHLNGYFTKMQRYNSYDATLCKVFPSTFAGVVLDWYHQIEEGRIERFEKFAAMFLAKYASWNVAL
ncbi:unnamed protein product [Linum trigynum]|uniref:Retrotransposon gag domain-containing protein n=1 Tax=Linum trigynum TaxID=586398 RepID=A0AAV2D9G7_9ROSI